MEQLRGRGEPAGAGNGMERRERSLMH